MVSKNESLHGMIDNYINTDVYPMHMPGHKRNKKIDELFNKENNKSYYSYDITEIYNFDYLHEADGILKKCMDRAAEFYGTKKTYFLVNGATCGLIAAVFALTDEKDSVLIARNCHKAVYNAVELRSLKVDTVLPMQNNNLWINYGISVKEVEKKLVANNYKAVIVTSPTYEGVVSDIESLAKVVHKYGAMLIVDEAHGAHFSVNEENPFPKSSVRLGADIVIQSLHKTLPSLTQTALLHVCSDSVDKNKVKKYLSYFQTSSPSYILMSSIDDCINMLIDCKLDFFNYEKAINNLRGQLACLTNIHLFDPLESDNSVNTNINIYDYDKGKIVLSGLFNGSEMAMILRKHYGIEVEMASRSYIIAMTSVYDTIEGLNKFKDAIIDIDKRFNEYFSETTCHIEKNIVTNTLQKKYEIYEAVRFDSSLVKLEDANSMVSCEYIYVYPPGIPIIKPGECYNCDIIKQITDYRDDGFIIHGMKNGFVKVIS